MPFVDTITKSYLKQKFSDYYSRNEVYTPERFETREWAFVSVDSIPEFIMHRHIAFQSEIELRGYLIKNTPLHAYFSSAYYEKPDAEKMDDKMWKGADLIFDIDADHLPKGGLEEAKKQIVRLYDLLESDFGIEDMMLVFSGGRGYHIHVHDEEFLALGSAERREIVDYVSLNGVSYDNLMLQSTQYSRVSGCIAKILENAIKRDMLTEIFRIKKKTAENLKDIFARNREKIYSGDFRTLPRTVRKSMEMVFEKCVDAVRIHVDPPVTADVKRLIRLPGSLHGKTSLRVTPLARDEIEEFEPFRDAVVFGDEQVRVRVLSNVKFKLKGEVFRLRAGRHELPEYAAVFLICRNRALYGW
ncbi:DNA primase catalytic subunit PriS [Geoglobus acetivorans]|uniref:DNA primase small subunit PriS n=1 Tax=Geoglobus acetivorans TaxID=565033 RepID=A0A0A7GC19_GEOAI|nr:DNA primase small subunit [Geoglobus acetivorans]